MLFEFWNLNKYGTKRTRILYSPKSSIGFGKGFGKHHGCRRFKYEYKHEINPPVLVNLPGKKILPGYGEVHPKTTLDDIEWIKPKTKKTEKIIHEFKSSSSDVIYKVNEIRRGDEVSYSCSCPGYFRKKNKQEGCKHIQKLRKN